MYRPIASTIMCNTSRFQQQRKFNRLEEITGHKFVKATQLSPRKFEVVMEVNEQGVPSFMKKGLTVTYYVYFGDTEVTFKPTNRKCNWFKLD